MIDAIIGKSPKPATVDSLAEDFERLGVSKGMTVLVHSSLKSIGWVCGGAGAVILSLQQVLTEEGTLVMPTQSTWLSEPSRWRNPPVPEDWWETIRQTMPPFHPEMTPASGVGIIPETFRKFPGVIRSDHAAASFAAWGAKARELMIPHPLAPGLGDDSPLGRLYEAGGFVLLIGVTHQVNTSLHLAEYRASFHGKRDLRYGVPILVDGHRKWHEYDDLDLHDEDFAAIGEAYELNSGEVRIGHVGQATSRFLPQRSIVDFAVTWMSANRRFAKQGQR